MMGGGYPIFDTEGSYLQLQNQQARGLKLFIQKAIAAVQVIALHELYGVTLTTDAEYPFSDNQTGVSAWLSQPERISEVYHAVMDTAIALQQSVESSSGTDPNLDIAPYVPLDITSAELFRTMMGPLELRLVSNLLSGYEGASAQAVSPRKIEFYPLELGQFIPSRYNVVHEFGHIIDTRTGATYARTYPAMEISTLGQLTDYAEATSCRPHNINSGLCRQNLTAVDYEEWADRFLFWVYDGIKETTDSGEVRRLGFADPSSKYQADQWIADVISMAYGQSVSDDETLIEAARSVVNYEANFNPPIGVVDTNGENLLLRVAPSTADKTITGIPSNASMSVLGVDSTNTWLLVVYNDSIGWVFSDNVTINSASDLMEIDQETTNRLTAIGYNTDWDRMPAELNPPSDLIP